MNTCGDDHPGLNVPNKHVDSSEYNFSEWFPTLGADVPTFDSLILTHHQFLKLESGFEHGVFVRLDSCSAKPTAPYFSKHAAICELSTHDRTRFAWLNLENVIIRAWQFDIRAEFRCFIHCGELRGISCERPFVATIHDKLEEIQCLIRKIVHYTEYDDCTIDLCLCGETDRVMLVEINPPVYATATSGYFDLSNPRDCAVLFGECASGSMPMPEIRWR